MKSKNSEKSGRFPASRTVRMTAEEGARLREQAFNADLSVAEYMRRLMFGGRPIVAKTAAQTIRELRRLGGAAQVSFRLGQGHRTDGGHSQDEPDAG